LPPAAEDVLPDKVAPPLKISRSGFKHSLPELRMKSFFSPYCLCYTVPCRFPAPSLRRSKPALLSLLISCLLLQFAGLQPASATEHPDEVPVKAQIDQHVGSKVDLNLQFTDDNGKTAALKDFIRPDRPTIIAPVYYRCPGLCTLTLNGVVDALNHIDDLKLGDDYNLLAVSFNPEETPELAKAKAANYYPHLNFPERGQNFWRFLVGSAENVSTLMKQIGFNYQKDEMDNGQFMHSAVILVLSPDGTISRYFGGVVYPPKDLRLSLVDASQGKIGGVFDLVVLYCFHFDPTKGKYTLYIMGLTKLICGTIVAALAGYLIWLSR
jgi:protein SCO1/2